MQGVQLFLQRDSSFLYFSSVMVLSSSVISDSRGVCTVLKGFGAGIALALLMERPCFLASMASCTASTTVRYTLSSAAWLSLLHTTCQGALGVLVYHAFRPMSDSKGYSACCASGPSLLPAQAVFLSSSSLSKRAFCSFWLICRKNF